MTVSVMITTRNRAAVLLRTCRVLRELNPAPLEVLITADGCTDETLAMVNSELPDAKLIVNATGLGSVASRDRMMREARGDLVLALDDDSYPEQGDCIKRIIPFFEQRPLLAVLHFPQRTDEYPTSITRIHFDPARLTSSFANSGAVLRRAIYMQLPGFEPRFFHMYEEPDYAVQCVAAGYEVYRSSDVTIRHHYSPQTRSEILNHRRHSRNEFWSIWLRCPFPYCLFLAAYRGLAQFRYASTRGMTWMIREPAWWVEAFRGLPYCLRNRSPIPWRAYKRWLQLTQSKPGM